MSSPQTLKTSGVCESDKPFSIDCKDQFLVCQDCEDDFVEKLKAVKDSDVRPELFDWEK